MGSIESFYDSQKVTGRVKSQVVEDRAGVGFALWIDEENGLAWAQGTHEYRPLGTAVVARTDQFRSRDFRPARRSPKHLRGAFAGFFGSLEEVNARLRSRQRWKLKPTPSHL